MKTFMNYMLWLLPWVNSTVCLLPTEKERPLWVSLLDNFKHLFVAMSIHIQIKQLF